MDNKEGEMSFCSSCGTDVGDAAFCPKCGASINESGVAVAQNANVSTLNQQKNLRQETGIELAKLYEYFNQKRPIFDEYDGLLEQAEKITKKSIRKKQIWAGVSIAIALMCFRDVFAGNFSELVGVLIFGGIAALLIYLAKNAKDKLAAGENRMIEIQNELQQHYNAYEMCPIGIEYCDPDIIKNIADVVRAGRADSIKEAINVLLDDAHKSTMELQAMLTTEAANVAANNARTASVNSGVAAAFSIASFFRG